jgi:hypothetical protein
MRTPPDVALNVPEETLPGYLGMVIREADGERVLESMVVGLPLRLKGACLFRGDGRLTRSDTAAPRSNAVPAAPA